ncbi:MAG: helix-turn-helix domain-containing GNAT family N-acetyltransferase [Desulfobacterales bacterium]|nr:helix-turn-helix domain-containing GNAT family N-acetyltransferase [Desulfobacterales bacterium]
MTVDRIRAFNRFYTGKIGLITNRFLKSEYSLVQARVLYELSTTAPVHAADLIRNLGLSADYLSKILSKFEAQGLITRSPSPKDARKQVITLTPDGGAAYSGLKEQSNRHITSIIETLTPEEKSDLVNAMNQIEDILTPKEAGFVTIRSHRPGDIGYVIHRHGVIYAREYGFNTEFDAYVAGGMADFIENKTPGEHLWIAECRNRFAGAVAIVRNDAHKAQLRWLIVEPEARQKGIGTQLVNQAVRFAADNGYRFIILWTIDFLHAARRLYTNAGFQLAETKVSQVWGKTLTEECWQFKLE